MLLAQVLGLEVFHGNKAIANLPPHPLQPQIFLHSILPTSQCARDTLGHAEQGQAAEVFLRED